MNVWGGWKDAGGDTGKYLSHLSFANFFNPQQSAMVTWVLAKSYDTRARALQESRARHSRIVDEAFWGADYLHRVLDPAGYFYETVFDRWGEPGAERVVTGYEGPRWSVQHELQRGVPRGRRAWRSRRWPARRCSRGAREGKANSPGRSIWRTPRRPSLICRSTTRKYCDDGVENIIDDYTALLAATELHRATNKDAYLEAARRARRI